MALWIYWLIAAVAVFMLELFSGTVYLLVLSAALAGAGLTAWLFKRQRGGEYAGGGVFVGGGHIIRLPFARQISQKQNLARAQRFGHRQRGAN